jgi:hypothetical protein
MAKQPRRPIPEVLEEADERYRRLLIFEAADLAYRRAGAQGDPDLKAWDNALADGIRK